MNAELSPLSEKSKAKVMMFLKPTLAAIALLPGIALADGSFVLPSGLEASLHDVIVEQNPDVVRFRFLAPEIAGEQKTYEEVLNDFPWLCEVIAVPALNGAGLRVTEVVISLLDQPVEFGEMTPEATQYFEPFTLDGDDCIWEAF